MKRSSKRLVFKHFKTELLNLFIRYPRLTIAAAFVFLFNLEKITAFTNPFGQNVVTIPFAAVFGVILVLGVLGFLTYAFFIYAKSSFAHGTRNIKDMCITSVVLISVIWIGKSIVYDITGKTREDAENAKLTRFIPDENLKEVIYNAEFTELGKKTFFLNSPTITTDKSVILANCVGHINHSVSVQGCFKPKTEKIYIFKFANENLTDVTVSTSTHEMLHAAYARLSGAELTRINALLSEEFKNHEVELNERLKAYESLEADKLFSELHSIIGTEIEGISPELEAHYAHYLGAREKIVAIERSRIDENEFQKEAITYLQKELLTLEALIKKKRSAINILKSEISQRKALMNELAKGGKYVEYNLAVEQTNQKISQFNKLVEENKITIIKYNRAAKSINLEIDSRKKMAEALDTSGLENPI